MSYQLLELNKGNNLYIGDRLIVLKPKIHEEQNWTKAFKIVSRQALKNAMFCHLKSYSCTSSGTRILPESRNLWQYPSTTASTGITL